MSVECESSYALLHIKMSIYWDSKWDFKKMLIFLAQTRSDTLSLRECSNRGDIMRKRGIRSVVSCDQMERLYILRHLRTDSCVLIPHVCSGVESKPI